MIKVAGLLYLTGFITLLIPSLFNWLNESHPLNLLVFWLVVVILVIATVMIMLVGRPRR
jgi:hypothetical protein